MDIKAGQKLGYLNPKTGKYKFVSIVSVEGNILQMKETVKQSNYGKPISVFENEYKEDKERIIKYINGFNPYGTKALIIIK